MRKTVVVPMSGFHIDGKDWSPGQYVITNVAHYDALIAAGATDVTPQAPAVIVPEPGLNIHGVKWKPGRYEIADDGWRSLLKRAGAVDAE